MQPEIPPPWFLRGVFALAFAGVAVAFATIAVDHTQPVAVRVLVVPFSLGLLAASARFCVIGLVVSDGAVVVRNVMSTRRVPKSAIARFGEAFSWANGGFALAFKCVDGSVVRVSSYPITSIPWVATRRRERIALLNDWLAGPSPS